MVRMVVVCSHTPLYCATLTAVALLVVPGGVVSIADNNDCIDVAIMGGGIGGAYTAWKLRNRGLSISVFEYSDRIGGRLLTTELPVAPGTYLEFGGMMFRTGAHHIFTRTAQELGLNIIPYQHEIDLAKGTLWYTRGKRLRHSDLATNNVPYNLAPSEQTDPGTLVWNTFNNNINFSSNTYPSLDEMYTLTTEDGTPLYKMSLDAFYGRYISREARNYIHDTSGWADSVGPVGALLGPKYYVAYPGNTGPFEPFKTIEGGMDLVPRTLIQQFRAASRRHRLHLNRQLTRIRRRNGGGYFLTLRPTSTVNGVTTLAKTPMSDVCAKRVILAAQKANIEDIDFPVFTDNKDIVRNLNSVLDYPAGKVFLAYKTQWWKSENPQITLTISDLPNRQSYDWQTGSNNVSILLASYHDGDHVRYWRELSRIGRPIPGSLPGANAVSQEVKRQMEKYMASIFDVNVNDIPEAVGGGMMLWDTYPYNAAWNMFKPGFDERLVRAALSKPSSFDDVYIVSNSWSEDDLQVWAEGSLVSAENVLNNYFR